MNDQPVCNWCRRTITDAEQRTAVTYSYVPGERGFGYHRLCFELGLHGSHEEKWKKAHPEEW